MRYSIIALLSSVLWMTQASFAADELLTVTMRQTAAELMDAALQSNVSYQVVESLTTEVGPRLAGTEADQLARVLSRGKGVQLRLALTPRSSAPVPSGNVIGEIPGRKNPDEIALIGAHLDFWDLGTGAVDDGAGVGIVVAAAKTVMGTLQRRPKHTIRVVLFGAEEVGLVGAKAYADSHRGQLAKHIIAAESDFGADKIWRFDTRVAEEKLPLARTMAQVLRPLGIGPGNNTACGGPDMKSLREAGVPVAGLIRNGWGYFDLHHTPDDTLDKIDPRKLSQNVAAYAALAYLAAEMDGHFRSAARNGVQA